MTNIIINTNYKEPLVAFFLFIFLINFSMTAKIQINCRSAAEYIFKKNCIKSKVLHQNKIYSH